MATICAESNAKRRKLRCPGARVGFSTKAYRDGMEKWEDLHEVKLFRSVCLCVLYSLLACMLYIYVYIRMKYMCIYIYTIHVCICISYIFVLICILYTYYHILRQSWWMILYFILMQPWMVICATWNCHPSRASDQGCDTDLEPVEPLWKACLVAGVRHYHMKNTRNNTVSHISITYPYISHIRCLGLAQYEQYWTINPTFHHSSIM